MRLETLTGIDPQKRKTIIASLDSLLMSSIITGYNWYNAVPRTNRVVTFSHLHQTEAYKKAMLNDLVALGYSKRRILGNIREKSSAFLHEPHFSIRDEKGNLFPSLRILDVRTGQYIDLEKYRQPLIKYPEFEGADFMLRREDAGWQLDMPFSTKAELFQLVGLFTQKSAASLYDDQGQKIQETPGQKRRRGPWPGAYEVPVLILGAKAMRYVEELCGFHRAKKLTLIENRNEISFIIHEKYELLKQRMEFARLDEFGFFEEDCLGNTLFIKQYIDRQRL